MHSDVQIGGDPLALPHLLPPVPPHPTTVAGLTGRVRAIAADRARWARLVRYDATTRWYHRLHSGAGYQLWLLSWLPGQGSGPHDHGRALGVFTVLDGELTERLGGSAAAPRTVRAGAERVIPPGRVHEIVNDTLEPAVSLHLYSPELREMSPHTADGRGSTRRLPTDRDVTVG